MRSATVLVGREAELDQLLRAVRRARAGQPSCILVVGEGGVGKSRLLGEATAAARRMGLGVAAGRAPITAPAPFSIIAQALRLWSRAHPLTPTRSPFDQGLRLVLPEWEAPDGHATDLTAAQLRLLALEGIGLVLRQIVKAGHGALLALDDLHAADPDSLEAEVGRDQPRQATVGRWLVDLTAHQVRRATAGEEETLRLTPTEWGILEVLLRRPGQLVGSAQLLTAVWGPGFQQRTNYLRFHMARLRRKLEENPARPRHLLTEPGMGYRYQP